MVWSRPLSSAARRLRLPPEAMELVRERIARAEAAERVFFTVRKFHVDDAACTKHAGLPHQQNACAKRKRRQRERPINSGQVLGAIHVGVCWLQISMSSFSKKTTPMNVSMGEPMTVYKYVISSSVDSTFHNHMIRLLSEVVRHWVQLVQSWPQAWSQVWSSNRGSMLGAGQIWRCPRC